MDPQKAVMFPMRSVSRKTKLAGLAISALTVLLFVVCPPPDDLDRGGWLSLGLLVVLITLWVSEAMPKCVSSLFVMVCMLLLGVTESTTQLFTDFANASVFFMVAVFGISIAMSNTQLPIRLLRALYKVTGNSSCAMILIVMLTTCCISTIISDLATAALIAAVMIRMFPQESHLDGNALRLAKCMMVGIPMAALTGGLMTPIGSPTNIIIMDLFASTTGSSISFLEWISVGIPLGIIIIVVNWLSIILAFRPGPVDEHMRASLEAEFAELKPMSRQEKKFVVFICIMLTAWISGSWIPLLSSVFVAICGFVVMFMPGVDLLTWGMYRDNAPWDLFLMLGGLMCLGAAISRNGAIDWVMQFIFAIINGWNPFIALLLCFALLSLLRALVPASAPVLALSAPVMITVAASFGVNPIAVVLLMAFWSQATYLLPQFDPVWLTTYYTGYYTQSDVLHCSVPMQIVLLLVTVVLTPLLVAIVGL